MAGSRSAQSQSAQADGGGGDDSSSNVLSNDSKPRISNHERFINFSGKASSGLGAANFVFTMLFRGFPIAAIPAVATGGNVVTGKIASTAASAQADINLLNKINDELERENDKFRAQNEQLRAEVNRLNEIVEGMEDTQNTLDAITKNQGQSIEEFEEQVEELKEHLRELLEDSKSGLLQNLLTIIISCDVDGDFVIDPEEVDDMIRHIEEAGDFGVNKQLFRDTVERTGGDIQAVLDMCKSILRSDDNSKEEQIFYVKAK
uniref:Uncharacterized protein n=1 Tax=Leptocylindrus danicus TaxID=163516 RepID=A0A6U2N2L7_9STRA|mmetsp:Transcript_19881/g.29542  ORF Transcript_19881/g.29542 Transcript_19881/m.29542 type:complete len:261 (+) Transcript_19881:126-908(+)|eukprot:CAMPEP_0116013032 /NCGR_PEP_ID=MMETSP0321-20121206/5482_1 /TAXON_ID=163516 /ORGANISM="Leptocylindrus danicus var. danicus, Strain B650" /LENGTH=260 /DNA_ID=CAMNT_0003482499 /DNA_START=104 /DNA_END=886 /DNA_ORIENTATION=-